jgi:predicted NBD/HSP70 family sugar kinase
MDKAQIGNSDLISTVNSRLILQAVRMMQPTYRAAVARQTGLKPATVTGIVNDLLSQQILSEVPGVDNGGGESGTRWGRPPLMLQVNADAKRIVAIDLEPDRVRVALTDLLVNVLNYQEQPIDRFSEPDAIIKVILKLAGRALEDVDRDQLQGVGVSLPGLIDREAGVLISSTNMPKWRDVPVRDILRKELGVSVQVERSIHLAAIYEKWSDPNHAHRTTLMLTLRTGVGISIMHHGHLLTGRRGFEGEIGHTVVDINGKACECGGRGCLETFVSASAICRMAAELMEKGKCPSLASAMRGGSALRPELIYKMAKLGDAGCAQVVREVGKYLGIAIGNMINLFAPDEVVICGSIDMVESLVLEAVREQINKSALPRSREGLTVRLAREKDRLPLLGAAVLVAEEMFELPNLRHAGEIGANESKAVAVQQ